MMNKLKTLMILGFLGLSFSLMGQNFEYAPMKYADSLDRIGHEYLFENWVDTVGEYTHLVRIVDLDGMNTKMFLKERYDRDFKEYQDKDWQRNRVLYIFCHLNRKTGGLNFFPLFFLEILILE